MALAALVLLGLIGIATTAILVVASTPLRDTPLGDSPQTDGPATPYRPRRGFLEAAIGAVAAAIAAQAWGTWISLRAYARDPLPAAGAVREIAPLFVCAFVAYLLYLGIEHRFASRRR
jgi:hypothetical protein